MQTKSLQSTNLIAWNGLQLYTPDDWESRVTGKHQLIFEKDFIPQLQIRWEKAVNQNPEKLENRRDQLVKQLGSPLLADTLPAELQQLQESVGKTNYFQTEDGGIVGGIFYLEDGQTLILFQLLGSDTQLLQQARDCLRSIRYPIAAELLWRIQDFSLTLSATFVLNDFTFGAGLTRLSFQGSNLLLHTCKLSPADSRLKQQSLEEILFTLAGSPDMKLVSKDDGNYFEGYRNPTILKQLLLRFRREKPFIRARIWHDVSNNRLLAIVFSSNRPISHEVTNKICSRYEII